MKTASKSKNQAAKASPTTAAQKFSRSKPGFSGSKTGVVGSKTEIVLAARWAATVDSPAFEDERFALKALSEALPQAGIAARLWRPFEDSLADSRCLHLFGTAAEFLPVVESARRSGVKVVLSPESWQNDADRGLYPRGWLQKTAAWFTKAGRGVFSRPAAWQRELYAAVDLLLPNSNVEAQRIARRFKLPAGSAPRGPARRGSAVGRGRSANSSVNMPACATSCSMPARSSPRTSNSVFSGP